MGINTQPSGVTSFAQEVSGASLPSSIGVVRAAVLSDSRGAQNRAGGPGLTANSWYSNGVFSWLRCLSGQRFYFCYNGAVSGDRTDQINGRIQACLASRPQIVFYWGGVNNIGAGYPSISTCGANAFNDIKTAGEAITRAGVIFCVFLDTPTTTWAADRIAQMYEMNQRIADWAMVTPGVLLFDAHRLVMDYTTATIGTVKSGVYSDATHVNNRGAYILGKALNALLAPIFPAMRLPRTAGLQDAYANNQFQLAVNGNFMTTTGGTGSGTGGITGNIPAGLSIARSGSAASTACSTAAATDPNDGNAFTMAITGAASGDFIRIKQDIDASATPTIGNLARGVYYAAACDIDVVATTNLEFVELYCEYSNGSTPYTYRDMFGQALGGGIPDGETYSGTLMTEPLLAFADNSSFTATYLQWYLRARFYGAGGAATVTVRNRGLRRLTALPA